MNQPYFRESVMGYGCPGSLQREYSCLIMVRNKMGIIAEGRLHSLSLSWGMNPSTYFRCLPVALAEDHVD